MKTWICQQILVLRKCFYNASHWVRQRIPVLREHFYDEPHFNQILLVIGLLFMISLPTLLFVPWSLLDKIWMGIFFGTFIVDHIWHNRYPALKRWITEREYVTLYKRFLQCIAS